MVLKRLVTSVPKNLLEAADFLGLIGKAQREIDRIQTELNEKVEKLKAGAIAETKTHETNISRLVESLFVFGQSHRDELTKGGRKTVELPTGLFGWRMTPPAISIRNVKSILVKLKELGLKRFIRVKEEINKEAMLKEPELAETIKGVSIIQREEFVVKPTEIEIEIVSDAKKLKKALI